MNSHLAVRHSSHNNEAGEKKKKEKYLSQEKEVLQIKPQSLRHLIYIIIGKQFWKLKTLLFAKNIQPRQHALASPSGFAPWEKKAQSSRGWFSVQGESQPSAAFALWQLGRQGLCQELPRC